jgi:hypothetical protein
LSNTAVPEGLYEATLARVAEARIRLARIRAGLSACIALASFAVLVPVVQYTAEQLYASGFYDYASLFMSDRGLVFTYWREFGLSLVESLPSVALLVLIPIAVALLWSVSRLIKNVRTGFRYA